LILAIIISLVFLAGSPAPDRTHPVQAVASRELSR
jgi:hypothetical protein